VVIEKGQDLLVRATEQKTGEIDKIIENGLLNLSSSHVAETGVHKKNFEENDPVLEPFDIVDEFLMVSPDQNYRDPECHLRKGNEYCEVNTGTDSATCRASSENQMGPIETTVGLSSRQVNCDLEGKYLPDIQDWVSVSDWKCTEENSSLCTSTYTTYDDFEGPCKEHSNVYQALMLNKDLKCEKEIPVWSIYTDLLQYSDHNYHKDDILYQPFTGHQYKKWKRKTTGYKIPHINMCEDFYPDIKYDLKSTYDPNTDISATYLWAQSEIAQYRRPTESEWFDKPIIPVDSHLITNGFIANEIKCRTLFDTGATKCMLNKNIYKKHKCLQQYPVYKIPPQKIRIADNNYMIAREAIKFVVNLGG